ncbi:hypothetical protein D3C78_801590 [compost metagenome]
MGDGQLLALFRAQRAVEGEAEHAEQAVERRADLVAHAGEEGGAGLRHVQRGLASPVEILVGLRQARVGRLQFGGARGDDAFQLGQVLRQAVLGLASLLHLHGDAAQLLVGHLGEHADFIVFVAARAGQVRSRRRARVLAAEGFDQADQRLGQQDIEEHQEDQREQQAAHDAGEEGHAGAAQEVVAEHEGVDLQAQGSQHFAGCMVEVQRLLVDAQVAEEEVADAAQPAFADRPLGPGHGGAGVVDDLRLDHCRRTQQAGHQFPGQLGVDVVGDARSRVVADIQQRAHFAVDGGVLAGIIDPHLDDAQQRAEEERHQYGEAGLLERKAMSKRNIHGGGEHRLGAA